jgi:hypothetical protein
MLIEPGHGRQGDALVACAEQRAPIDRPPHHVKLGQRRVGDEIEIALPALQRRHS